MKNTWLTLQFILILLAITSCATFDSVTLYKTSQKVIIHRLGFVDFSTDDNQNSDMYVTAKKIYKLIVPSTFKQYGFDSTIFISNIVNCYLPDTNEFKTICATYNIDGIIISTFKYVYLHDPEWSVMDMPGNMNTDLDVEMKLYDKNGHLIITTFMEATMKSILNQLPSFESSAMEATRGTAKLMTKEIKSLMKKK